MKNKITVLILVALLFATTAFAQLVVNNSITNAQMVQNVLLGQGITATNISFGTTASQIGQFSNGNTTNLGLTSGIVLCTGTIFDIPNTAATGAAVSTGSGSDAQLASMVPGISIFDAAVLEFDMIPRSDTIQLRYVFASEEYPDYVCSGFNDIFGFFITGPNPSGGNYTNYDMAVVPGTTIPVSINSINSGTPGSGYAASGCTSVSNSNLFVNNGAGTRIVYGGFTVPLRAKCKVVPNATYHIKLAVADASDQILDSGVFLEAGSLSCNRYALQFANVNNVVLGDTIVSFLFNQLVKCNTVNTNDFRIVGPDGIHTVMAVSSSDCSTGGANSSNFTLTVHPAFTVNGNYTLSIDTVSGSIITTSGLIAGPISIPFILTGINITTAALSNITSNSVDCGGNVLSDGGNAVTMKGVCWSTLPYPTISSLNSNDGSGLGSYVSNISGLNPGITYYIRAYAVNSAGVAYGNIVSFTSLIEFPTVVTTTVSNVTGASASISGNVFSDGGATVTTRGICWSTNANPTTANSVSSSGSGTGAFTSSITGLTALMTYHARAYATNSMGTSYGSDTSFATTALLPTISTTAITNITNSTATSGGNITFDGGSVVTEKGVCWSTTWNPTISNSKTSDGTGTGTFISNIAGLVPGTTYYLKAYATNSVGTSYGAGFSFTTSCSSPAVLTIPVSNISGNSAQSGGNITLWGAATITCGVCWGTNLNPIITNSHTTDIADSTNVFSSNITGLVPLTTYHVRAYITNCAGTSYGNDFSFTTTSIAVSGVINYDNTVLTPMSAVSVILLLNSTNFTTTTSDAQGNYIFNNVANGTYSLNFSTTKPWGGVTATDVLKLKRHIAGLEILSEPIKLSAADVNNSSTVNSTDALKLMRRIADLDASFTRSDWNFEKPTTGGNTISVSNTSVSQNFYALCTGDINGSYVPTLMKNRSTISFEITNTLFVNTDSQFELPIRISKASELGAIQLFLNYPENLIEVLDVKTSSRNDELMYSANNGSLRIVWASLQSVNMNENDAIITLKLNAKNGVGNASLELQNESELADAVGNVINDATLKISNIEVQNSSLSINENDLQNSVSVYPNPANNIVNIDLGKYNYKNTKVTIYNSLGEQIFVNKIAESDNIVKYDFTGIKAGLYIFKIYTSKEEIIKRISILK